MAALFGDFSFEAASRPPSSILEAERAAMNVSPTSMPSVTDIPPDTRLPTPPPCSIGELAHRFDQQSLRVDTSHSYSYAVPPSYEPLTPPSDDIAFSVALPESLQQCSYAYLSPAALRWQRQAHMRMQCSPSHAKDISNLVQRMIEDGDQCKVCDPKSRAGSATSSSLSIDEDEGVDMDYSPPNPREPPRFALSFRRSGDRVEGHPLVSRSIRMRKKPSNKVTKRSSR